MEKVKATNKLVINHFAGTIDRHYANGRIDYDIGRAGPKGAKQISVNGARAMLVHRVIYADFHGPIAPWMEIDHIHGKEAGNGIENLRWTTSGGNSRNRRKAHKNNRSGFLGVSFEKNIGKYRASITFEGKQQCIGFFHSPELAHEAYVAEKRRLHETCTI